MDAFEGALGGMVDEIGGADVEVGVTGILGREVA
jgi:hypothetical protein